MNSDALTWLEIDSAALRANVEQFRRILPPAVQIMPVVKSNAYGHGMMEIAILLAQHDAVAKLAVVSLQEALTLREEGIAASLFVLSYADWFSKQGWQDIDRAISQEIEFPVYSMLVLDLLIARARQCHKPVNIHLKIDTGTSRVGFLPDEIIAVLQRVRNCKDVRLVGVWTHLARAENPVDPFNKQQLRAFSTIIRLCRKEGFADLQYHASASAALMWQNDSDLNLGRLGISLYGLWPSVETRAWMEQQTTDFILQPVMSWKTRLIQVKNVPAGSFISYDATHQVQRVTRLGIIPVGYYDGFDRGLSNKAHVLVRGGKARVLGRVCMNLTMVDVTDLPAAREGDEVVIMGRQGDEQVSAEMLAGWAGTINYEIVSRIHPALPRFVI